MAHPDFLEVHASSSSIIDASQSRTGSRSGKNELMDPLSDRQVKHTIAVNDKKITARDLIGDGVGDDSPRFVVGFMRVGNRVGIITSRKDAVSTFVAASIAAKFP